MMSLVVCCDAMMLQMDQNALIPNVVSQKNKI